MLKLFSMVGPWLNFTIVAFIQLLFFLTHACYEKKVSDIPRTLGQGVLIGIGVGLLSDLVLGKFFGLWSYTLGFGALSLTLNTVFVYGLFAANILLMRRVRLVHFFIWTIVLMAVYEISSHFFRVWRYEFVLSPVEFLLFLLVGYFGTAIVIAVLSYIFPGRHFVFIDNVFKK